MTYKIPLVKDTIDKQDINSLIEWLSSEPRLTKGSQTKKLEKIWSQWLGVKNSIYVNSGSSANLLAAYALLLSGKLKNKKVVVPAVSWVTTVSPFIQFGYDITMCDCNLENYGLDVEHLKKIIREENPGVIITVNVLGFSNNYEEIYNLCKENDIFLIEDSCESIGTIYNNKKTGTFGNISTFSFYFGHHLSTIEGGMVCTDDEDLKNIITSIRSHGWDRDLDEEVQKNLRKQNKIENFKSLYTFYYPGFNCRSTDLQAFIGIKQMEKADSVVQKRHQNFLTYNNLVNGRNKVMLKNHQIISNFAFPYISKNIKEIVCDLDKEGIETRPLICGSIGNQPFWKSRYGKTALPNADIVDSLGIYLPNNPSIGETEIGKICEILNKQELEK